MKAPEFHQISWADRVTNNSVQFVVSVCRRDISKKLSYVGMGGLSWYARSSKVPDGAGCNGWERSNCAAKIRLKDFGVSLT